MPVDALKALNDAGEAVAVLASVFALLLAGSAPSKSAPSKSGGFGMTPDPARAPAPEARVGQCVPGDVADLGRFRNRRRD